MKVRITIDLRVDLLEWVKKRVEEEKISRNMWFERLVEDYKAKVENEEKRTGEWERKGKNGIQWTSIKSLLR